MKKEKCKIWVKKGYGSKKMWLEIAKGTFKYAKKLRAKNKSK